MAILSWLKARNFHGSMGAAGPRPLRVLGGGGRLNLKSHSKCIVVVNCKWHEFLESESTVNGNACCVSSPCGGNDQGTINRRCHAARGQRHGSTCGGSIVGIERTRMSARKRCKGNGWVGGGSRDCHSMTDASRGRDTPRDAYARLATGLR